LRRELAVEALELQAAGDVERVGPDGVDSDRPGDRTSGARSR
jgi:hypothetical protein